MLSFEASAYPSQGTGKNGSCGKPSKEHVVYRTNFKLKILIIKHFYRTLQY